MWSNKIIYKYKVYTIKRQQELNLFCVKTVFEMKSEDRVNKMKAK